MAPLNEKNGKKIKIDKVKENRETDSQTDRQTNRQ